MSRSVHHIALLAYDLERVAAFYTDVLGLREERRWPAEDGSLRSIWLDAGGARLMIERAEAGRSRRQTGGAGWHLLALSLAAQERRALERHLASRGIDVAAQTEHTLYIDDPEGNRVGLSSYPAESAAGPAAIKDSR